MKIRNPIRAPQIIPAWTVAYIATCAALLATLPWAWLHYQEVGLHDRLLTEKVAEQMRVDAIVVKYANGRSVAVTLKERQ